jgi:ribose transport system ATP-binding protein
MSAVNAIARTDTTTADASVLDIRSVSKTFDGQTVLKQASLTIRAGEIHALVGQNGSGKSTLIKILAGFHTPDDGSEAFVNGERLELGSASAARAAGLRFVHQDLGVIGDLTVTENVLLGERYPIGFFGRVKWKEARALAASRLQRLGLDIDPRAKVAELEPAARAGVAIARATSRWDEASAVLVLDEPTAFLSGDDVETLFDVVRRIAAAGQAVMIVTHHLEEVLSLSDVVTVLRDGRVIANQPTQGLDKDSLTKLIVGQEVSFGAAEHPNSARKSGLMLSCERLVGATAADVSFGVQPGEILGIAGLAGSGREALAALVSGRTSRVDGRVLVDGQEVASGDPLAAIEAGIGLVPGERVLGIFADQSIRQNLTIAAHERHVVAGRINARSERAETKEWIAKLGIVARGPDAPIRTLSGGNQQKVLIARALRRNPKVLLLDDPTVGIDIGARAQIHRIIADRAAEGTAVVLVSTDSEELVRLADRVLIVAHGRLAAEISRGPDLTVEAIDTAQLG